MKKHSKPKVAFFDFTDCEGCQLQFANMGSALLELTELVDIVNFREIMSEAGEDYEVAFIEGSITTDNDVKRIKRIREKAKAIISLGACATIGGVNGIKNRSPLELAKQRVYGDKADTVNTIKTMPVHEVVKVDYFINGCPVYIPEVISVVKCVLMGKPYIVPNYAVCVECKMNENVCRYEKDQECLGPVTRAGCNSWCINYGNKCYGCRGLVDNPASAGQKDILLKYGITLDDILQRFTLYNDSMGEKYDKDLKQ
ncbi:MAG: cytochrome B [Omnitrophica WOR_2 bacterium GWF2_43_52]|nr:MAG: cytochrome B [Omnitrophica WOR_2 bacterium GWC2_44_8]OGX21050.1 MAG: cytochrome B [Omnitrophica WOR_2 bacterium GWF2_43_52]HAH20274.1 cytochrome B [Candidatus Omnitrophota bacterium]HBG64326.1 cytochrome B [Candidatus Omnitrophota bacterium]